MEFKTGDKVNAKAENPNNIWTMDLSGTGLTDA
jgi:hypothetical protein